MVFKTGILFCAFVLGCLAVPVPEEDVSIYFSESPLSRIVGGNQAAENSHPWMAGINTGTFIWNFFCGGSIISQRTVLTAAHCIQPILNGNSLNRNARVAVGTNRWNQGGQQISLSGFVMHERYDRPTIKYDIGVLYTASNINFNNNVQVLPLNYNHVGSGVQARVAGWGATRAEGPPVFQLLEIVTRTIDGNQCVRDAVQAGIEHNMLPPHVDPSIELCTFHQRGIGVCSGDSGSALVRIDNGQQIGIVSWGFPCAIGGPDMFVRVSAFQAWIQQHTRN